MEEEPSDPHEQQLYAVFKSCLAVNQNELNRNGLLSLCNKLELEEHHKNSILDLLKMNVSQKTVSFSQFKDSFLHLLGSKSIEGPDNGQVLNFNVGNTTCSQESKQIEAMNCQQLQDNKLFQHQKIQETWSNHTSLTIEDVNSFCNRGPVLPKQTIELIFEKLDTDCDGLINLEEFSSLFQNVNRKRQEHSSRNWSIHLGNEFREKNSDCCRDQAQQGYVMRNVVIDLWEVAGVSEASSLLVELGFDSPMINLVELSNALSSELKLHRDVSHVGNTEYVRLLKGALTLYQEEVRSLNSSLEHLCCERDKLRVDIVEANERANILAQEVDEHQTRMDKARQEQLRQLEVKHLEALKDLTNQLHQEREKSTTSLKSLEDQLIRSQQEEQRIRNELSNVLKELKLLEQENQSQNDEITKLESCNSQLSMQVRELATAHDQVESIETKDNEQVTDLMAHIKRLQAEMKILRDHNDELTSELEMLKHRDNDVKSIVSSVDIRSTLSDENDGVVSIPTTEVSDTEDEEKQQSYSKFSDHSKTNRVNNSTRNKFHLEYSNNGNSVNRLSEIIHDFRNFLTSAKLCAECSILRNEVSSLISELELYQSNTPCSTLTNIQSSPNKKRKQTKNLANELEAESNGMVRITESCRDLVTNKNERSRHYKRISSSDDTIHDMLDENLDKLDIKVIAKNKLSGLRDYPTRKVSGTDNNANKSGTINNLDTKKQNISPEVRDLLKEEEARHLAEKRVLIDRVSDLEKSLELLKAEYEQCEDYWASKLDEERQLFEQEQKISDEKFTELIEKIADYEEQFNMNDKSRNDGRLSPIEEKVNLEAQYNDLEDEFERWKMEAQEELDRKEREIEDLKERFLKDRKISLIDSSAQCPDEQMKSGNSAFYYNNAMCSPSGSAENGNNKVPMGVKTSPNQQCLQCHKLMLQTSCDCQATHQQQSQQNPKRHRDGDRKNKHRHYYQKKNEGDLEYKNLLKQKEKLKQEIIKLQSLKAMNANHMYPLIGTEEQNIFANLYSKLYAQEQKQKYLQFVYHSHQKESQRAMHEMWKQHIVETGNLRSIIKTTQEKLNQQMKMNKEKSDQLTKGDFLTKELYVENAKLTETVKRLEQHCQILTQGKIESTTV